MQIGAVTYDAAEELCDAVEELCSAGVADENCGCPDGEDGWLVVRAC